MANTTKSSCQTRLRPPSRANCQTNHPATLRDAEREQNLNEFLASKEDIVSGTVKRVERHGIIVEVVAGKLDALIPREEMIPRENFRSGDRIRALFLRVDEIGNTGRKQVILSRTSGDFLAKLYANEVPEIADGLLEIREVARDPGQRAKVAVKANDQRIDRKVLVSACAVPVLTP